MSPLHGVKTSSCKQPLHLPKLTTGTRVRDHQYAMEGSAKMLTLLRALQPHDNEGLTDVPPTFARP